MTRLEFDIPDYMGGLAFGFGAGVRRQIAFTLANAHVRAVEDEAKANAPVKSKTLKNSIRAKLVGERRGVLEVKAPYAKYLHHGTGIYGPRRRPIVIGPKSKKALHWPGAKHPVKSVTQRGIEPRDFLRLAMRQHFAELHTRAASLAWAAKQPSNVGKAQGAEKGDWWYPILHPIEFYQRADELRRWGQNVFEGPENSFQRHYHASHILTREYGQGWARLAGTFNEIQGFYWWDIPMLPSRLRGETRWAFQIDDLTANELGIRDAMLKEKND